MYLREVTQGLVRTHRSLKKNEELLTGIHINEAFEEAMITKCSRVLDYFQSLPMEKLVIAAKDRA